MTMTTLSVFSDQLLGACMTMTTLSVFSDQLLGAWCPAVSAPGEWLEVRLPRPFNVTALLLQVPVVGLGDGQAPPTLDSFSLFLELADSPPGELTQFRGLNDSTEVSTTQTNICHKNYCQSS